MSLRVVSSFVLFLSLIGFVGCTPEPEPVVEHVHDPSDVLVWPIKETVAHPKLEQVKEFDIWIGHHGDHFHAGDEIEPAVAVIRGGTDFQAAKCNVTIVLQDPEEPEKEITDEYEMYFEPKTELEIGHFAQVKLQIPADAENCVIRYRIDLGTGIEVSRDLEIKLGH